MRTIRWSRMARASNCTSKASGSHGAAAAATSCWRKPSLRLLRNPTGQSRVRCKGSCNSWHPSKWPPWTMLETGRPRPQLVLLVATMPCQWPSRCCKIARRCLAVRASFLGSHEATLTPLCAVAGLDWTGATQLSLLAAAAPAASVRTATQAAGAATLPRCHRGGARRQSFPFPARSSAFPGFIHGLRYRSAIKNECC